VGKADWYAQAVPLQDFEGLIPKVGTGFRIRSRPLATISRLPPMSGPIGLRGLAAQQSDCELFGIGIDFIIDVATVVAHSHLSGENVRNHAHHIHTRYPDPP
jgi:hypothetical protein